MRFSVLMQAACADVRTSSVRGPTQLKNGNEGGAADWFVECLVVLKTKAVLNLRMVLLAPD